MKKWTLRRILAIAALVLIACMYLITIICALIDSPFAKSCLMASLFCTIVVPAVLYGFLVITKQFSGNGKSSRDGERNGDRDGNREDDQDTIAQNKRAGESQA